MRSRKVEQPRVLSLTPGRVRVHLPGRTGNGRGQVEGRLRQVRGVEAVEVNPLTGNVLIRFDPRSTGLPSLLAVLQPRPESGPPEAAVIAGGVPPRADHGPGLSASPLLRFGVRGFLGHAAVDAFWFGAGYLGRRLGLPLSGLGPLHVLLDVVVWGTALAAGSRSGAGG
jgi:hypothetical protein